MSIPHQCQDHLPKQRHRRRLTQEMEEASIFKCLDLFRFNGFYLSHFLVLGYNNIRFSRQKKKHRKMIRLRHREKTFKMGIIATISASVSPLYKKYTKLFLACASNDVT